MISASSSSLGLASVTVKEKRYIRTLTKTRQHPTNVMAGCYGDVPASNYVLSGGNCGCRMSHPLTLKARGLERGRNEMSLSLRVFFFFSKKRSWNKDGQSPPPSNTQTYCAPDSSLLGTKCPAEAGICYIIQRYQVPKPLGLLRDYKSESSNFLSLHPTASLGL